jgi:hypothetical protein
MTRDPRALDYVLGALSAGDRAALERRRLHDAALDHRISALEATLSGLLPSEKVDIGSALWAKIAGALEFEKKEFAEVELQSFGEGKWEQLMPGVEARTLWGERTRLLRCQPGAADAEHQQEDDEHILMIAGDLMIGGRVLTTGDHLFFPTGSRHPAMRTVQGCILLMHYC